MEISDEQLAKLRRRHAKTERHRRRQARKPRCEVICWGKKGPHQCDARGQRHLEGHIVCSMHYGQGRRSCMFTVEDAKEYRRKYPHKPVLEMTNSINGGNADGN